MGIPYHNQRMDWAVGCLKYWVLKGCSTLLDEVRSLVWRKSKWCIEILSLDLGLQNQADQGQEDNIKKNLYEGQLSSRN